MVSQLVIDVRSQDIAMALLEDGKLVEFQREKNDSQFSVGDIYLGTVKKIMPGLNAAFVNVGSKKDAFLHYDSLGKVFGATRTLLNEITRTGIIPPITNIPQGTELPKDGHIEDYLQEGQRILVQVGKEAISTKGPSLSAGLSFSSHSIVLTPFGKGISISRKIKSKEEQKRLKQILRDILPEGFGLVARTSANGKDAAELKEELDRLYITWCNFLNRIKNVSKCPCLLFQETGRALSSLRDTFNASFSEIVVNDSFMYEEVRSYISEIASDSIDIVKHYTQQQPIFDAYSVTRQLKSLLGKTVTYKGGAYLVIEQTEAMHVIDVNSGNRSRRSKAQEDTALDVNLSAAEEIARQMRLRDLGGIIVVDFIDMNDAGHRQQLYEHMCALMKSDRAQHNILPLSKFCLMQITRKRVRQAVSEKIEEKCPTCLGSGKIQPSILFTDRLERSVSDLNDSQKDKHFTLHVHPYVASYLQRRKWFSSSLFGKWKKVYGNKYMRLQEDESLAMLEYKFYTSKGEEIDIKHPQR